MVTIDLRTSYKSHIRHQPFDKVTIGEPLLKVGIFPYATVSGIVKSIERKAQSLHITIENDRKDNVYAKLKNFNTKTLFERYFQTVLPLESFNSKVSQHLMIMGYFFNEPFVSVYPGFIIENQSSIRSAIEFLKATYQFKRITFLISQNIPQHIQEALEDTHKDIQIKAINLEETPNHMTHSINRFSNQALFHDHPFNLLTIDSLIQIAEIIKYHRPPTLSHVIFSGDLVRQPSIVETRFGTPIIQLIDLIGGLHSASSKSVIKNEIMRQIPLSKQQETIDKGIKSLHFNQTFQVPILECIVCGACNDHCPVGIIPSRIMRYYQQSQSTRFLAPYRCIECGLCSFYCPSKIPVSDFVKQAKTQSQRGLF